MLFGYDRWRFGGQSAPPSLKPGELDGDAGAWEEFRGAVRPPFIEAGAPAVKPNRPNRRFGGQSAPPSLKLGCWLERVCRCLVSGGSPPPLH